MARYSLFGLKVPLNTSRPARPGQPAGRAAGPGRASQPASHTNQTANQL